MILVLELVLVNYNLSEHQIVWNGLTQLDAKTLPEREMRMRRTITVCITYVNYIHRNKIVL